MSYDPFSRGPHPVGVRTIDLSDSSRSRYLPTEVWYPATAEYAGKDTAEETRDRYDVLPGFPPMSQQAVRGATMQAGRYPLIVFSHGFGGHRRQSTFLCTHLASHGYVVAAVDHTGNTVMDMAQMTLQIMMGQPMPDVHGMITELIEARPADIRFIIDRVLAGDAGVASDTVDESRIGLSGHSFGGWTTLKTTGMDRRIRAALALPPAGGPGPLPGDLLVESLDFEWGRDVPTLLLVADKDTLLPLSGMHDILGRASCTKRMIVLENADHMHFCDDVEQTHELFRTMPPPGPLADIAKAVPPITDLCPGTHAYEFNSALGLAHMDANLKGSEEAAGFLTSDLVGTFAERGIKIQVV